MTSVSRKAIALGACLALLPSPAPGQTYPGVRFVGDLVPGSAGDPDGKGTAQVWFDQTRNRICATITIGGILLPAHSTFRSPRLAGGYLIYMPTRTSSGCMAQDENTRIMISTTLSGTYVLKPRVCVYNNQYQPALCADLRRG